MWQKIKKLLVLGHELGFLSKKTRKTSDLPENQRNSVLCNSVTSSSKKIQEQDRITHVF